MLSRHSAARWALPLAMVVGVPLAGCSSSGDGENGRGGSGVDGGGIGGNAAGPNFGLAGAAGAASRPGTAGASALTDANACGSTTEGTQNTFSPADIIMAVDQSTSMADETPIIQDRLDDLAAMIGPSVRLILVAERAEGVDPTTLAAVPSCAPEENTVENPITIPPPLGTDAVRFRSINCHVDSTDAWESVIDTYPLYEDFLRPEATKHVVVITDDESNMSADEFDTAFRGLSAALTGEYIHDAIVPFDTDCPFASGDPSEYRTLTGQTGGVEGDLCTQDFQALWEALAAHVASTTKLSCEWIIPPAPAGVVFDKGLVNVRYTSEAGAKDLGFVATPADCGGSVDGWYYDDLAVPTKVLACPELCAEIQSGTGQKVDILFGCATEPSIIR